MRWLQTMAAVASLSVAGCGEEDPGPWERVESGTERALHAVSAPEEGTAWAAGEAGTLLRWDGARWTREETGVNWDLTRIRSTSAHDVWVAGDSHELLHFDGDRWERLSTSQDAVKVQDVLPLGPDSAFLVNAAGVWRWEGERWELLASQPAATGAPRRFRSIWGSSPTNLWVAEGSGRQGLHHFNGERWTNVTPEDAWAADDWLQLSGTPDGTPWVLRGRLSEPLAVLRREGAAWTSLDDGAPLPASYREAGLWAASGEEAWLASADGQVLRWTGSDWEVSLRASQIAADLLAITGTGSGQVWAVGEEGVIVRLAR